MSDLFDNQESVEEVLIEESIKASYLDTLCLLLSEGHCPMRVTDLSLYTEEFSMQ